MKFKLLILFIILSLQSFSQDTAVKFHAINHASFVIESGDLTIWVDPVGNPANYKDYPDPDLILITHGHQDHYNKNILEPFKESVTTIIAPKSVIDLLGFGVIMNNGNFKAFSPNLEIHAIPMYNLTKSRLQFHSKGDGNGYVLTLNDTRIYISGDTEDIPEMLALKDIDHAFICMNLPFTMSYEQAANAVLKFKPKNVFPYHYRGEGSADNIEKFKQLVSADPDVKVIMLDWY
ncbi:MAG: MBL fold metallo-hydrolase [Prolixibacteraceae bacterium]|nr:MBL fold metallo-hydrolase [Prolixibacteraceae bacterium]